MCALRTAHFKLRGRFSCRVLFWLAVAGVCFLAAGVLFAVRTTLAARLYDQRAVYTWSEDGEGASQLTVFYPFGSYAGNDTIRELEYNIRQELVKASVPFGEDGDAAPFVSCMSATGSVSLVREGGGRAVTARAVGTYGDFFRFHPLTLLSGALYAEDLLTPDRILIDEDLAWQLFGSFDVAGKTVQIGGVAHTVAGVFSIPKSGLIERQAGIPENLCFLSLESLCQLGAVGSYGDVAAGTVSGSAQTASTGSTGMSAGTSGTTAVGSASARAGAKTGGTTAGGSSAGRSATGSASAATADGAAVGTAKRYGINTWEIVMPDPVKNFAVNIVREKVKADRGAAYVVENSARFTSSALVENLRGLWTRGMQTKPVVYPWWENVARGYTNVFSLLWLLQTALTVFACGILAVFAVLLWRRRTWTLGGLLRALMDKKYDLESRMRYAHDKWEHF